MRHGGVETDSLEHWRMAGTVCIIALAYGIFVVALVMHRAGDVSRFVMAGGPGVDAARAPRGLTVIPGIGGYDGITFYRLALDPFTSQRTAFGISLDDPPYRQQRIGYPAIVWLLALGDPSRVPALLVAVNFLAILAMSLTGCLLAKTFGRDVVWGGLLLPLFPGFLHTLAHDTSEIVACAFVLGGILALRQWRSSAAAALITAAVLTRETTLLVPVAFAAAYLICLIRRSDRRPPWPVFTIPVVAYATWQVFLALRWGASPIRMHAATFTLPFDEYVRFVVANTPPRFHLQRVELLEALFLSVVAVLAVAAWRHSTIGSELRLASVAYVAFFAMLPHDVWSEDVGFMRVLGEFYVVSAATVIAAGRLERWILFACTLPLWIYLAMHILKFG